MAGCATHFHLVVLPRDRAWSVADLLRVLRKAGILCVLGETAPSQAVCPLAAAQSPQGCPRGSQVCGWRHTVAGTGHSVCVLAAGVRWNPVMLPDAGRQTGWGGGGVVSSSGDRVALREAEQLRPACSCALAVWAAEAWEPGSRRSLPGRP